MTQTHHIISANDLRSGLNVYLIQKNGKISWDEDYSHASYFDKDTVTQVFDLAKEEMNKNIVVDCIIVPVDENHSPLTTREKIRANGPSIKYGHDAEDKSN